MRASSYIDFLTLASKFDNNIVGVKGAVTIYIYIYIYIYTGWAKSKYTVIKVFFICFEVTCSVLYVTC